MARQERRAGDVWTPEDDRLLRELANRNTPTRVIGVKLGRSEDAVYSHARAIGLSLKPANRSPYGKQ